MINTGGEEVFAEEVEQALLMHPAVQDAPIVGAPDERWGSRIVRLRPPRQLVVVGRLERSPSGKADLTWARGVATAVPT